MTAQFHFFYSLRGMKNNMTFSIKGHNHINKNHNFKEYQQTSQRLHNNETA